MKIKARYVWCKLKNIAVNLPGNVAYITNEEIKASPYLDWCDHLPDNCIRLNMASNCPTQCGLFRNWCDFCKECYGEYK